MLLTIRIKKNNKLIFANQNSKHLEIIFRKWRDVVKQAFSEQNDKFLWSIQKYMCKGDDHSIIWNCEIGSKSHHDN